MSQRPLVFIIPISAGLSSVSGGQGRPPLQMSGPKPPSVREVSWPSAMTEGETQYALSLPQSASPTAPSQRGPRKRSPAGQKNRPFAAHKSLANVRAARVKIGSFPRRARRNLRYTTRICYNNSLYRAKITVTPAFRPSELCL